MEKLWLTPEDQLRLDPYGENYANVRGKLGVTKWTPAFLSPLMRIPPEEALERYTRAASKIRCARHEPYWSYNLSHLCKWGRQGGTVPISEVMPIITELYERPYPTYSHLPSAVVTGQRYLRRFFEQLVQRYGYPQPTRGKVYDSAAALPTGKRKGSFDAETMSMDPFRHVMPARYGTRHMRNGPRLIFEDSVCNVRWIEPLLSSVRFFLREHVPEFFNGWLNPHTFTAKFATDVVRGMGWSIETDYKKMDRHVSLRHVEDIIYPLYEVLMTPSDFLSFQRYCEEAFNQPLYMGDYLLTGRHMLFSGQPITNDIETLLSVNNGVGVVLEASYPLKRARLLANGDDLAILLFKLSQATATDIMQEFIKTSEDIGLEMSPDKCGVDHGVVHFCRQVYYPAGRLDPSTGYLYGAYPGILCWNNIFQPEHPHEVVTDNIIPTLQRLDGCFGSPDYFLLAQMTQRFAVCSLLDKTVRSNAHYVDWWERLYGEEWSPENSPTLRFYDETLSGS